MKITDVFSWIPTSKISIEELEQIFIKYYNGTYKGAYTVLLETPDHAGKNILDSREELIEEGRNVAYILEGEVVVAVIGYSYQ